MKKILGFFILGMILLLTSCEPTTLGRKNTLVNIAELGLDIYGSTEKDMDKTIARKGFKKIYYEGGEEWKYAKYAIGVQLDSTMTEEQISQKLEELQNNATIILVSYRVRNELVYIEQINAYYILPENTMENYKKLSNQLYTYHQNLFPFVQSKEDPDEFDSEFLWQGMIRLGETFYACDNDDVVVNQAYLLGIISKEEYDTWKANKYDPNATREAFVSQLESTLEVGEIYSADNDEEGLSSSGLITTQKNADLDLETIPVVSAYWTVEKNVNP